MEDSSVFMQWAMTTLQNEQPEAAPAVVNCSEASFPSLQALREASRAAEMVQEMIVEAHGPNSCSSGSGDGNIVPNIISTSNSNPNLSMSWEFSATLAQTGSDGGVPEATAATRGLPELVYGSSPSARRAGLKIAGSISTSYAQDHIIAERKRREKINQRFIELSAVIPGLKKMDKATILSDATRYVKELKERIKAIEDGGNGQSVIESVVLLVKKPCITVPDVDGSPSATPPAKKTLPEIEARITEKTVMVRIHCEDGKGVVVRLFTEVEELHLSIIHANVMPFPAGTLIIAITAKVEAAGFTVTAEEIVGRLHSACNRH
ncbi:hypothetical protein ACP4OV_013435 [Aristida adscensionis]